MSRLLRWYGAGPLHLLAMIGSFALAGYAAAGLLRHNPVGILVWFVAAVIGHDLLLMPLYTLADKSVTAVFRHRPLTLPAGPWINYLRVPAVLSGFLLLIWFPLIFRLPARFPTSTTLPLDPYLWHWLAVTGALFLLSATALALRLGAARRSARNGLASSPEAGDPPPDGTPDHPVGPEPARDPGQAPAGEAPDGPEARTLKDVAPPAFPGPATAAGSRPGTSRPAVITARVTEKPAVITARVTEKPAGVAPAGTLLPDADLLDGQGAVTTLYAATGAGPSVLVFHPGAWSPNSNIVLSADWEQLLPQLTERGINLVVISPQKPDEPLTMPPRPEPAFTVVSDPGNTVAGRLGIVTLPMPVTVILDASHTVRWINVHPDYSTRTEPQQVIDALDHLA